MSESKGALIGYLYQSISDTQATIRQLDLKANAVLIFLTLLLTVTDHLRTAVICLLHSWLWRAADVFMIAIPVTWFLAILFCYRALNAVFDPSQKIDGAVNVRGTFFSAAQFKIPVVAALFGRGLPKRRPTLEAFYEELPVGDAAISKELAFEQLKLVYIRDLKSVRVRFAFLAAFCCLALSAIAWLLGGPWPSSGGNSG